MGKWTKWYNAQPEHVRKWLDAQPIWYNTDLYKVFGIGFFIGLLLGLIM